MSEASGGTAVLELADFASQSTESMRVSVGMFAGQTVVGFYDTDIPMLPDGEVPHTSYDFLV